jgi:hypothetical protein
MALRDFMVFYLVLEQCGLLCYFVYCLFQVYLFPFMKHILAKLKNYNDIDCSDGITLIITISFSGTGRINAFVEGLIEADVEQGA